MKDPRTLAKLWLPESLAEHLFQLFTRLSGEHSSGLGLSIVKILVEAHKGSIHGESDRPGRVRSSPLSSPLADQ